MGQYTKAKRHGRKPKLGRRRASYCGTAGWLDDEDPLGVALSVVMCTLACISGTVPSLTCDLRRRALDEDALDVT